MLLKFHGQLSNAELARALGISESNAGTRLHRALSALRARCSGATSARRSHEDHQLPDRRGAAGRRQSWNAELEAALNGDGQGPAADSWRELRADVRSLAPALDPALEQRLREEIDRRTARDAPPRRAARACASSAGRGAIGALATAVATIVVALVLVQPGAHRATPVAAPGRRGRRCSATRRRKRRERRAEPVTSAAAVPAASAPQVLESSVSSGCGARSRPAAVGVAQPGDDARERAVDLRRRRRGSRSQAGGYVASSHVQVQQGSGEANLTLRLPSARLSATLASIARLAPVRSESQSLQDITSSYDAARQRLTDASAERAALLRALAKASSAGEIDSLREQLSQARSSIAHDQAALRAVSQRASNAEVEVTVLGSARAEGGGLSVHRGLHDAGRVLGVALAVLLIGAAVLVPLALLIAALAFAARAWRRHRREHALDAA